jgi:hypothetical protein
MKTLKESILGSTNTGKKNFLRDKIEEWCNKHLKIFKTSIKQKIKINNKLEIEDANDYGIDISASRNKESEKITEFPDYIKFGNIKGPFYIGDEINLLSQEQLPKSTYKYYIYTDNIKLKNITITTEKGIDFLLDGNCDLEIEKLNIIIDNNRSNSSIFEPSISAENTSIKIKDLKNINIEGEIGYIYLEKTPASQQIKREISKYKNKGISVKEYFIQNFPNLIGKVNFINLGKKIIFIKKSTKTDDFEIMYY